MARVIDTINKPYTVSVSWVFDSFKLNQIGTYRFANLLESIVIVITLTTVYQINGINTNNNNFI